VFFDRFRSAAIRRIRPTSYPSYPALGAPEPGFAWKPVNDSRSASGRGRSLCSSNNHGMMSREGGSRASTAAYCYVHPLYGLDGEETHRLISPATTIQPPRHLLGLAKG